MGYNNDDEGDDDEEEEPSSDHEMPQNQIQDQDNDDQNDEEPDEENNDQHEDLYIDVDGKAPVRIEVGFGDFHGYNLAYHVGTPITLTGNTSERNGRLVLTKVTDLKSVFGKSKPGKANG